MKLLFNLLPFIIIILLSIYSCDNIALAGKVKQRDINCDQISELLDSVMISDQRVRRNDVPLKEMVKVDYDNLSTVVSILESCGMPNLETVTKNQLRAIFFALQHSPESKYREKYFPLIQMAVVNGDLHKEMLALMSDRILMHNDHPQIFGTQIQGDQLYKLYNPENVNVRREAMDMSPIEEYLELFDLKFDASKR